MRTLGPGPLPGGLAVPAPGAPADVWLLHVPSYAAALPADLWLLDASEEERYLAFVRDVDRTLYGAAHVGLRRLLGAYLGRKPDELAFGRETCPTCDGPHGRPCLKDADGVHFSLSHGGEMVLVALAGTPVGADVEKIPQREAVEGVWSHLHPRERAELAALPEPEQGPAFARCWTRKEAYLKGTGEGMSGGLDRDYVGTGPAPAALPGWQLADCPVGPGHGAAIAVAVTG
jgi:4'-phosphopantetheinyl transferase